MPDESIDTNTTARATIALRAGPNLQQPIIREYGRGKRLQVSRVVGGGVYTIEDARSDRWAEVTAVTGDELERPLYAPAVLFLTPDRETRTIAGDKGGETNTPTVSATGEGTSATVAAAPGHNELMGVPLGDEAAKARGQTPAESDRQPAIERPRTIDERGRRAEGDGGLEEHPREADPHPDAPQGGEDPETGTA